MRGRSNIFHEQAIIIAKETIPMYPALSSEFDGTFIQYTLSSANICRLESQNKRAI